MPPQEPPRARTRIGGDGLRRTNRHHLAAVDARPRAELCASPPERVPEARLELIEVVEVAQPRLWCLSFLYQRG